MVGYPFRAAVYSNWRNNTAICLFYKLIQILSGCIIASFALFKRAFQHLIWRGETAKRGWKEIAKVDTSQDAVSWNILEFLVHIRAKILLKVFLNI